MAHMMSHHVLLLCFLVSLSTFKIIFAVEYTIAFNDGVSRFTTEIGSDYCMKTLGSATDFVFETLQQNQASDRKDMQRIALSIEDDNTIGIDVGTDESDIHISNTYIELYSGDVKEEITGFLYHSIAQVWIWNGNSQAPPGLTEGIADYVRLKAGYESSQWVIPGEGDRWDQGNDVTARFLHYCNSLLDGFVAELNKKMRDDYSDTYFCDLLEKTVDQLWDDYKLYYSQYSTW